MYETVPRSLRTAERFLLAPPLMATFGPSAVSICDISAKGARFRHGQQLEAGSKSILKMAVEGRQPVSIEAVIVWTQGDAASPGKYVSGVRTLADTELMDGLITHLRGSNRTSRIEELRSADRYVLTPPLEGRWNAAAVSIEDLSTRGARIATGERLGSAASGTFRFSVPGSPIDVEVKGQAVWTSVKAIDVQERVSYRAGIFINEKADLLRLAIGQLCELDRASIDAHSLQLKLKIIRARARQLAPSFRDIESAGVPAEQYLLIQGVREELRLNPDEALHWYRRARLCINDPVTRSLAPPIADHPDALAVWEYLDRSIDPSIIGRTFSIK